MGRFFGKDTPKAAARRAMNEGADLLDDDLDGAEAKYREAVRLDPELHEAWFDLGLVHKWRREWTESLACNRRAIAAMGRAEAWPEDPAFWNAGIAATALRDWETARWAWTGYGLPVPAGVGPIEGWTAMGCARLPEGEVVWGDRLDPARLRIGSIPLPDSGFHCGDVVLTDGAPSGERISGGRTFHVFPVIELWEPSGVPTVQASIVASEAEAGELVEHLRANGVEAEDWTTSIHVMCAACSEGSVDLDDPGHDHGHGPGSMAPEGEAWIGCAGAQAQVSSLVVAWCAARSLEVIGVEQVG